jgi:hypothetical protein
MAETKAATPKSKDQYMAELLQSDPEKYYEILGREEGVKAQYKEPKRPEDRTGVGEAVPLIKNRKKERDSQISEWENSFSQNVGLDYPIYKQLTDETNHPGTLAFKLSKMGIVDKEGNPLGDNSISAMLESAKRMPPRPTPYEVPTGNAFSALSDSVEIARQDPQMAAALMGVGEQPATMPSPPDKTAPAPVGDLKPEFTPEQAAFVPDMNDPEIQKAYKKLQAKEWTQEQFDTFAKQWMGR